MKVNKKSTGYQIGYDVGKRAQQVGGQGRFYRKGTQFWERNFVSRTADTVVDDDQVDFAGGYLDGFERAREQSR